MATADPITLTPKQARAWHGELSDPNASRILFDGGARSTKTTLIAAWVIGQAATIPGARLLVARKHADHARVTLFDLTFRRMLAGVAGFRFLDQKMEIQCRNGSVIRVAGLDDAERTEKILGDEYLHAFLNEAVQLSWDTVQKVATRLSQSIAGVPTRKLILDCNPRGPRHWLYQAGVKNVIPGTDLPLPDAAQWRRRHWTPYDNPHLPADAMRALESLTGVQRRRLLDGVWCENEGAVYGEFNEDVHVVDALPSGHQAWRRIRGIDFGFTNPFVRLCGAIDHDGALWIYRERYVRGVIVSDHAAVIKREDAGESFMRTVADHDAEDRATLHAHGIMTLAARKEVGTGIKAVKKRLMVQANGRPRLYVLRCCTNLIQEFAEYAWADPHEGKAPKEVPEKTNDHALDALRYMVMDLDGPARAGVAMTH